MTTRIRPAARTATSAGVALALTLAGLSSASAIPAGPGGTLGLATVDAHMLEVIVDTEGEHTDGYVLVEDDGSITEVSGEALEEIPSGSEVEATVDDGVVSAATVLDPVAAAVAVTGHDAYVVTIDDATTGGDVSAADATDDAAYALDYWVREGRGAFSSFDIAQTRVLSLAGSCAYTFDELWEEAAALFPAVDFATATNHLIVYTPTSCVYDYLGVATIGRMTLGGYVHIAEPGAAVTVHELGHNLGLGHSDLLWGDVFGAYGFAEYYGAYSPMAGSIGTFEPASLDAAYRAYLDLPGVDAQTAALTLTPGATEPQVVTLGASTSTTGTTAVTFDDDYGFRYFVDYRDGAGTDAPAYFAGTDAYLEPLGFVASYAPGVVLTMMEPGYNEQYVFAHDHGDGTLQTSFRTGDTYVDPMGQFTLDVVESTASSATVALTPGPATATTARATATKVPYRTAGKVTVTVAGERTPMGTVTLSVGSREWTRTLNNGKVTFTLPKGWKPGTRTLTARYSGSLASQPSTTTVKATVTKATPKVTAVAKTAVRKGARATFVATVSSSVARETGYVQMYVGTTKVSAKYKLVRSGSVYKVRLTTWKLPKGRVSVKYLGNTYLKARKVATSSYAR
ncbi:Ig-like domain repeat protein [Demequina sp. SYSU T00192]|uniref:Ig-like domain repeat protein n=1 Tax=Demequina litoralis TaxID=3051660 RepID=A0ABT8G9I7_9MICO|nr:Ig-like domain repeat protein [Demequina sp. SYSU T00192]MDN4475354.1 Ig-like domain repeat protein [Demequina sp. SYSU T00192]